MRTHLRVLFVLYCIFFVLYCICGFVLYCIFFVLYCIFFFCIVLYLRVLFVLYCILTMCFLWVSVCERGVRGYSCSNRYRMCSLTIECVLFLCLCVREVFVGTPAVIAIECVLSHSRYRMCFSTLVLIFFPDEALSLSLSLSLAIECVFLHYFSFSL